MTGPGKIGLMCTSTVFHFLFVRESTTQKHQVLDDRWPGLLSQMAFYRCCQTTRMNFSALRGINRTGWGTKLLLTAVLAHPVDCISSGLMLNAQHCCSSPNGCFSLPSDFHPPPPPPTRPPPQSMILQAVEKLSKKPAAFK